LDLTFKIVRDRVLLAMAGKGGWMPLDAGAVHVDPAVCATPAWHVQQALAQLCRVAV